ncbi:hypothetical protein CJ030_MR1G020871 [Morella rubra]|uniref:Uncharacterized protein n=1 Tax=Morella rubra TaxID=262757 RepID=A0A6A1WQG6_9ROSI|nr:hypothetical protein CJ030_MR1G020871 [Morella rubra]
MKISCLMFPYWEGSILGQMVGLLNLGPELIGFFSAPVGSPYFWRFVRGGCLVIFDHFPIILESGFVGRGKKLFRFENMWLKADGFVDRVGLWWRSCDFSGSPSFVLDSKLKALKRDIKIWNYEVFGDIALRKSSLLHELSSLDIQDEGGLIDEEGRVRKLEVLGELDLLIDMEETSWRQKSRALWLKDGDRCTKFFHRVANSNRKVNSISSLEVEGELVEDPERISDAIISFYSSLYREPFSWRPSLDDLGFDSINREDVALARKTF